MLEQLVSELQKHLQELKSGGSSDRQTIERLEKEIEELHKERTSSRDKLRIRIEQLHKGTQNSDKSISEAKDYLNNEQIQCILEELEGQLNDARLEVENKEQRIQELEKELADLKNLSTGDQESLQEEINRLRQFLSDDDYKNADMTNQIKQLAILTEQNSILQQKLEREEIKRREERENFENNLCIVKEVNLNKVDLITAKYESRIKNIQSEHDCFKINTKIELKKQSETIRKMERELVKSRKTLMLFNQLLNDYDNKLVAAVNCGAIPSSMLDGYITRRESLAKQLESENCYSEDYVNQMEDPTERQLDAVDWTILHLEAEIEELQKRLGGIKESEERNEKLEKLVEKAKKLEICLQMMMQALPEEKENISIDS
ncbi:hypothetical protein SBV43_05310 [Chlamydia crocodili]